MKVALLIGFQYQDDPNKYLPGILVDLYLTYQAVIKMGVDRFLMVTDIRSDLAVDLLRRALSDDIIDSGILSFVEESREKGFYCSYSSQSEFIARITEIVGGGDRIFVYYTGHGDNGDMLLPSGDGPANKLDMYIFRRCIVDHCIPRSQVFFLLDCCSDTQMKLPYKMVDGKYRLFGKSRPKIDSYETHETIELEEFLASIKFTGHDIVCLSSASTDGFSHITEKGSFFTQGFFHFVNDKRTFRDLIPAIEEYCYKFKKQTVTCYTSDPRLGVIWGWLLGLPDVVCQFDCSLQAIKLSLNDHNHHESDICLFQEF